ncbi:MAG: hypothetical protein PVSMB5_34270 [Ktedonobacteraceae bacterium]
MRSIKSACHMPTYTETLAKKIARFRIAFEQQLPGNFGGIGTDNKRCVEVKESLLYLGGQQVIEKETSKIEQRIINDAQLHGLTSYIYYGYCLHVLGN